MTEPKTNSLDLGVVIIGRNEGERLVRCLRSIAQAEARLVYVDSGSTDGSVEAAHAAGAEVLALDMSRPFTAARARNTGLAQLGIGANATEETPASAPEFVQFIDGDCEIQPGWLAAGMQFLQANPKAAVVAGRLRECAPETSAYNALCDAEWDVPPGEVEACGGIAMMRAAALTEAGLFDAGMIAGEEPELCLRMRRAGWQIWRVSDEMALHDAAMTRFGQFWRRMRRGGFAFALWVEMHGATPDRFGIVLRRRALLWGLILPLGIAGLALLLGAWALALILVYPAQIARLALREGGVPGAWRNATLLTLAKFAEAQGVLEFHWRRLMGRPNTLIEHK